MTLVIIAVGTLFVITRQRWRVVYDWIPGKLSFTKLYDVILRQLDVYSNKLTTTYMTGSVRHYMIYILGATVIGGFITIFLTNGFTVSTDNLAPITIIEISIVVIMVDRKSTRLNSSHVSISYAV